MADTLSGGDYDGDEFLIMRGSSKISLSPAALQHVRAHKISEMQRLVGRQPEVGDDLDGGEGGSLPSSQQSIAVGSPLAVGLGQQPAALEQTDCGAFSIVYAFKRES